ncbi:MAG TPA: hypothetical protein VK177_12375 [Flavobacteriales bacterium]|nr:hypothetical protein [Flavobacteriales bacterium]
MKKSILILAFPLALVACGGGGPEGDAQVICDMMKDWKAAKDAGNNEEMERIEKEGKAKGEEFEKKYEGEEKEKFKNKVDGCEDEYIK